MSLDRQPKIFNNILELIGDTPLVKLNKITQGYPGTYIAKIEAFNPGQSSKDRIALYIIEDAEKKQKMKDQISNMIKDFYEPLHLPLEIEMLGSQLQLYIKSYSKDTAFTNLHPELPKLLHDLPFNDFNEEDFELGPGVYDEIKKIFTQFKQGKKHNYMKIWNIICLEAWFNELEKRKIMIN